MTTDNNRRQRAKQYWPIRRASNKNNTVQLVTAHKCQRIITKPVSKMAFTKLRRQVKHITVMINAIEHRDDKNTIVLGYRATRSIHIDILKLCHIQTAFSMSTSINCWRARYVGDWQNLATVMAQSKHDFQHSIKCLLNTITETEFVWWRTGSATTPKVCEDYISAKTFLTISHQQHRHCTK